MTALVLIALAALGMILGSFAIATVWRLHAQEELLDRIDELEVKNSKKHSKATDKKIAGLQAELRPLSISKGRSMCSHCGHPLAPKDLLPLASYIWLRGRCRYCRHKIEDTPLLEALLPVAFVVSYLIWPLPLAGYGLLAFCLWLVFLTGFAALTVYDIRWYLLPDRIVWPLAGLALVQTLLHIFVYGGGLTAAVSAAWGVAIASGIFFVLYQVSKGQWIGGGDVKLGIILGLLTGGPLPALLLLFLASLFGTIASLPMLVRGRGGRHSIIPFGPFLMLAAAVMVLFGGILTEALNRLAGGSV